MTTKDLNNLWLYSFNKDISLIRNNKPLNNQSLYKGNIDKGIKYNLKNWINFPITLTQFLCLLHNIKTSTLLELIVKEVNIKYSPNTTKLNLSVTSINDIQERIETFYQVEIFKISSVIAIGEISEPAYLNDWLKISKKLNIPGISDFPKYCQMKEKQ